MPLSALPPGDRPLTKREALHNLYVSGYPQGPLRADKGMTLECATFHTPTMPIECHWMDAVLGRSITRMQCNML